MRRNTIRFSLMLAMSAAFLSPPAANAENEGFGLKSVSTSLSTQQAGAHADFTVSFELLGSGFEPAGRLQNAFISLPPGMIGNPQRFPRCSQAQFGQAPKESQCPQDAQLGITEVTVGGGINGTLTEPIYNMYSPGGDIVARFGFFAASYPVVVNIRVNPVDYSLVAAAENAPSGATVIGASTTLWGVPASPLHDTVRLTPAEALAHELPAGGRSSQQPEVPFLSNPTQCGVDRQLTITATSYQAPNRPSTLSAPFPQIFGCDKLSFNPNLSITPTNPEASAPTGLDAVLEVPQDENPKSVATSTLKSANVTLPEGFTINPAAADGLQACTAEQVGVGTNAPAACPDAAKLGSVELDVPALEHTLQGSVYQRAPEPGKLFRFWVVTDEQGVHLKLPAEIQVNPLTGQLSTAFAGISSLGGNPQVPFEELRLHISGGPRAPLATPSSCGTYGATFDLAPWSGRPAATGTTPMQISGGCSKGGFEPKLAAGTVSPRAGSYSPFVFTLTREDGEANPSQIAVHLPQGLLAKLAGVPRCPEAQAPTGACPADSRIGSLTAATGVGGAPLWVPQPGKAPTAAYLAGPYKGAPYSIVSVVPAQAGPFDLGTVVNRAAIQVDPETALATIRTDPLPQILEGVPVLYRTVHVLVDRKNFTLNPTGCEEKKISATVTASNGASAEPTAAFQATNCAKLAYKPKLKLSFKGDLTRLGNPAIHATLTQKPDQANTKAATVILPPSSFIDNSHIPGPCTRVQFAAHACPKDALIGRATAKTPLLDEPLKGPVYFRSNGGARELPDVVADLRGPLDVVLVGWVDSVRTGPESSRVRTRFPHVPDAPVTKFTMDLFGGKKGLVENTFNLCRKTQRAELRLRAHSGRDRVTQPAIEMRCGGG